MDLFTDTLNESVIDDEMFNIYRVFSFSPTIQRA